MTVARACRVRLLKHQPLKFAKKAMGMRQLTVKIQELPMVSILQDWKLPALVVGDKKHFHLGEKPLFLTSLLYLSL